MLVNTVVDTVAFPLYAKVNDNQEKMQSVFNQIQDGIIVLVGAMAMVFISFGYQIISLILGDQWVDHFSRKISVYDLDGNFKRSLKRGDELYFFHLYLFCELMDIQNRNL